MSGTGSTSGTISKARSLRLTSSSLRGTTLGRNDGLSACIEMENNDYHDNDGDG